MLGGYIGQFLQPGNNLSDVQSASAARMNLGLGSAATQSASVFDAAGSATAAIATAEANAAATYLPLAGGTMAGPLALKAAISGSCVFVDPVNGSDSAGNGTVTAPFLSPGKAAAVVSSGQTIFVLPGVATFTSQVVLPAGVNLVGSGMDVTTLNFAINWNPGGTINTPTAAPCVVVGTGCVVSDLTISTFNGTISNSSYNATIGVGVNAIYGSTQNASSVTLRNVRNIGLVDCLYLYGTIGSFTGACYNCVFQSSWDTTQHYNAGSWKCAVDYVNCQFIATYSSGVSTLLRCVGTAFNANVTGLNLRLFGCLLQINDSSATQNSSNHYVGLWNGGASELYGNTFEIVTPSFTPTTTLTSGQGGTGWTPIVNTTAANSVRIGGGNTFDPNLCYWGGGTITYPASPESQPILTMTVSSSAATPIPQGNGNLLETAVDAGTLTSSTLTINAPATAGSSNGQTHPNNSGAMSDGMKMRLRIKNTNASSTAMTLSFNSVYDVSAFTVGTIAAGTKAYLDFTYDADNSKFDLTGYVSGI